MNSQINEHKYEKNFENPLSNDLQRRLVFPKETGAPRELLARNWSVAPVKIIADMDDAKTTIDLSVALFGYQVGYAVLTRNHPVTTFKFINIINVKGKVKVIADFNVHKLQYDIEMELRKGAPPKFQYSHYAGTLFDW